MRQLNCKKCGSLLKFVACFGKLYCYCGNCVVGEMVALNDSDIFEDKEKSKWIDFDSSTKNDQLQDDKNYLIRYKDAEGIYSRPHIAWWDAEDSMFRLLDAAAHFKLHVDQYFEIPE